MILDTDKEPLEEKDFEQEEFKVLTEKEKRQLIDSQLKEYGYEMDPELIPIVNKEGDFEEWIDPLSNYMCRISRHVQFQTWNGYVRLPSKHPCFGEGYDDIDVNVHGGLTFSDGYFPSYTNNTKDGYWWVGFDTSHAWDRQPRIFVHFPNHFRGNEVYRTKEYVKKEVTSLAKQLKDMEGDLKK
jgi:hypothetical protein